MHHDAPKTKRGEPVQTLGPEHKGASTQITNVVLSVERRCPSMRMTTDKMYYGNYRFVIEFDSGSETGSNQLTVWVAEKAGIDGVPLKQFGAAQLLSALVEPERSRLHAKLEEERRACQQPFELEIANLQHPFKAA